ncbi:hypothetical protein QM480_04210 [Flectobacillus sp. DC10W]|uniref:Uncharacterized protein n=1 Tax=Flectobacillus longus TaxID=2984207 RepID=A0ABT6YIV7_9BACT|nr:hypothetical protein [Flectobacillus longus]MDI9863513.1 hypothetical protein [Flectobacillus longus]
MVLSKQQKTSDQLPMKRPNILSKVYDVMDDSQQETFRQKLKEIGLNPRVFHENYKLDTCKINVMDCYDLMVLILAPDRQFEHPYYVLDSILNPRKKPKKVASTVTPEPRKNVAKQVDLEEIIEERKEELKEVDLSSKILRIIFSGYSLQQLKLTDGSLVKVDPRYEYHYKKDIVGYRMVAPTMK